MTTQRLGVRKSGFDGSRFQDGAAAVKDSGCVFLLRHVTVNLAPADFKKEGSAAVARAERYWARERV